MNVPVVEKPLKVRILRLLESSTDHISAGKLEVPTKLGQLINLSRKDFSFLIDRDLQMFHFLILGLYGKLKDQKSSFHSTHQML